MEFPTKRSRSQDDEEVKTPTKKRRVSFRQGGGEGLSDSHRTSRSKEGRGAEEGELRAWGAAVCARGDRDGRSLCLSTLRVSSWKLVLVLMFIGLTMRLCLVFTAPGINWTLSTKHCTSSSTASVCKRIFQCTRSKNVFEQWRSTLATRAWTTPLPSAAYWRETMRRKKRFDHSFQSRTMRGLDRCVWCLHCRSFSWRIGWTTWWERPRHTSHRRLREICPNSKRNGFEKMSNGSTSLNVKWCTTSLQRTTASWTPTTSSVCPPNWRLHCTNTRWQFVSNKLFYSNSIMCHELCMYAFDELGG